MSQGYRADVDGLRAVAIILVILFHYGFGGVEGGFVGVDVFFVISGFLITRNIEGRLLAGRFSLAQFYWGRARRLFPALFVWIGLTLVASAALMTPAHFSRVGEASAYSALSISNFFFWSESGYFDESALVKPLLHTWSLGVEMQFYLFWPLILLLLARWRRVWSVQLGVLIGLSAASVYAAEQWLVHDPDGAFFLPQFRLAEFGIGALCARCDELRPPAWMRELMTMAGLTAILFAALSYTESTSFPGLASLTPCAGAALVIAAHDAPYSGAVLRNRIASGIGLISYSLYLVHWPIWVLVGYWWATPFSIPAKAGLIAVSGGLAFASYRLVEQPSRRGHGANSASRDREFGFRCLAVLSILCAVGWHVAVHDGWRWRTGEAPAIPDSLRHHFTPGPKEKLDEYTSRRIVGADKPGAPDVLVIGDSHAEHLKVGLDYLGEKANLKILIWSHNGCPPVFGTSKIYGENANPNFERRTQLCAEQIQAWQDLLKEQKFAYVILAARWMWLFEPTEYEGEVVRLRRHFLVDSDRPSMTTESSRKVFIQGLERTVREITRGGARGLIVSQPPLRLKRLADCENVPRLFYRESDIQRRCEVDFTSTMNRLEFTDRVISETAARNAAAFAWLPSRSLCDEDQRRCRHGQAGVNFYRDESHLSARGALYLAKDFEPRFQEFLGANDGGGRE